MSDQADPRVRAALDQLAVPDHDEQFWQTLGQRLIAEREAPAAPTFDPLERLEQVERNASAEQVVPHRKGRWRRHGEQDQTELVRPSVSHLAEHAQLVKPPRRNWRRRLLVTTCVALVAGVIALAVWIGISAKETSPTTTAGQVAHRMSARLGTAHYVLGEVTTVGIGGDNGRYAFVRSADGSFRYRGLDRRSDTAYDSARGRAQSWRRQASGAVTAAEDSGLAPGPPDADGSSRYLRNDELAAIVRSLEGSPFTLAKPRRSRGREVWVIDLRLATSAEVPVDAMRVVVDRRRRLPLEVSRSVKGTVIERKQFSDVRFASTVSRGTFQLAFPKGTVPHPLANGFRRTKLPSVQAAVNYTPATPQWLPSGYELSTAAVLPGGPPGLPATAGGDNPPNRDVVSLAYRRGVGQITVTTRRAGTAAEQWKDPFGAGRRPVGQAQQVRLDRGRFLGTTVEQVGGPSPHLWGRTSDLVFTVAGDLDPSELLRVANSLS